VKVVFDTNIFISALVIPGSQAEKAITRVSEGHDILFISKEIIHEILSVLSSKFRRDKEALSRTAVFLSELAVLVKPHVKIDILKDKTDNKMLECAVRGNVDVIVTGDKEILKLEEYKKVKIISLRDYLKLD
jgi:putative PIN family toxin of toxin-antitoxin system